MATRFVTVTMLTLILGMPGTSPDTLYAAKDEGSMVKGSGFSLFETESIRGYDEKKVQSDPVCDRTKRPEILEVVPDIVKPGDKVVIKGKNFGKKECFRGVSFSKASKANVTFKYVNSSTIEATVPNAPSGLTFVITLTGAGSAQSKGVLITK